MFNFIEMLFSKLLICITVITIYSDVRILFRWIARRVTQSNVLVLLDFDIKY